MWTRTAHALTSFGCVMLWMGQASAEANSCAAAYEQAQELRSDGKLQEARRRLELCVAPSCSEFIRAECNRWLVEVEASLPTVVLAATRDGREVDQVQVYCDDRPLTARLDGKAIAADPGPHTLRFVADGVDPILQNVVLREGEKNRLISVALPGAVPSETHVKETPAPPAVDTSPRQTNWTAYGLAGLGVLGVAGFAVLGLVGNSELADRERSCAPTCRDSEVTPIRTKYYLADISLGIGVVSLGVAGYMLFAGSTEPPRQASNQLTTGLDVVVKQNGGLAAWRTQF